MMLAYQYRKRDRTERQLSHHPAPATTQARGIMRWGDDSAECRGVRAEDYVASWRSEGQRGKCVGVVEFPLFVKSVARSPGHIGPGDQHNDRHLPPKYPSDPHP